MRILLDESLPRRLAREFSGHEAQTVQSRGWAGLKNGELLRVASTEFQALLTGDQNLEYQQNIGDLAIALLAVNNRIESLRPLVPEVLKVLATIQPGELVRVGA